jgi:hypothetical protein
MGNAGEKSPVGLCITLMFMASVAQIDASPSWGIGDRQRQCLISPLAMGVWYAVDRLGDEEMIVIVISRSLWRLHFCCQCAGQSQWLQESRFRVKGDLCNRGPLCARSTVMSEALEAAACAGAIKI